MENSKINNTLIRLDEILFGGEMRECLRGTMAETDLKSLLTTLAQHFREQTTLFNRFTTIGLSLSREKDISAILEKILVSARELTHADAGTLYLLDPERRVLTFEIVQNDTINLSLRSESLSMDTFSPVPLEIDGQPNIKNVSSYVALRNQKVNIPDVYTADGFDFTGTRAYDHKSGYRSESMLVIPMQNHEDKIIGVLQLINSKNPETGQVMPFYLEDEEVVGALASQAAVVLTKAQLIRDLENLLNAFIKSIAVAIDGKSPFTGRHVDRVVELALLIADALNTIEEGPFGSQSFSPEEIDELRISSWLHDVGKITTPEHILDKKSRLESIWDREELIKARFSLISLCLENAHLKRKVDFPDEPGRPHDSELDSLRHQQESLDDDLNFLLACNRSGRFINEEDICRLNAIASRTYTIKGETHPYLTPDELALLSIRKGTLSPEERDAIENHAAVTRKILQPLPFPEKLANVAEFAAMHHERIDGSGYPLGLSENDIPLQARIIAVADVFEALTALDRPYKKPIPLARALKILEVMKKDHHLDPNLVDFFIQEKVYRKYASRHLSADEESGDE